MPRQSGLEMLLDDLSRLPWWVSVMVAAVVYVAVSEVLPRVAGDSTLVGPLVDTVSKFAGLIAGLFLIPAAASAFRGIRRRRMLAARRDIDEIRALSWQDFERLVEAYYEREGHDVVREGGSGPDGGIDLRLRRHGETCLVQCKQWRTRPVGVKVVRELYGVVSAEHANSGILVTSGSYTDEAERFAAGVEEIQLVDGEELLTMIGNPVGESSTQGAPKNVDAGKDIALTNVDVLKMTSAGVGAAVIVAKIESSATDFDVGVEELIDLGKAGVADAVISAMVHAERGTTIGH